MIFYYYINLKRGKESRFAP